jgi:hypothetical protein
MTTTTDEQGREYKSADGTEVGRKENLLKEYARRSGLAKWTAGSFTGEYEQGYWFE